MTLNEEPWHEIVFVCPECRREFKPQIMTLSVRLCPKCSGENASRQVIKSAPTGAALQAGGC
jgi:hypothetical protein